MSEEADESKGVSREQAVALAIVAAVLVLAGAATLLLSSSSSNGEVRRNAFGYPNVDISNSRHSGGSIQAATVASLQETWAALIANEGSGGSNSVYLATPVIADGVLYSQDTESNVQAIEMASGDVQWTRDYGSSVTESNGVVVAGDRVYGTTATSAFALDRGTGKQLWSVRLTRNRGEGIGMAPGYRDGLVYVSTTPRKFKGNEVGILWALDAMTGRKAWSFNTVPKKLWGHPDINFGGGVLETPAFDEKGFMYVGVGSPGPVAGTDRYPWGTSRPGPNLYTNSVVKLNATTGKIEWHYQLTPHALCDWDLQAPPLLVKARGRDLVVAASKAGIVVALDRETGELVWKQPVGTHSGHDQDGLLAMKGDFSNLEIPMEVSPGALGGVFAPLSTDGDRIFVPVVNNPWTLVAQGEGRPGESNTGELVALDATSGAVEWKKTFIAGAMGATSAVNDLVFATTLDGGVYAFNGASGEQLWESQLPAGTLAGLAFSDDMLIAPAGTVLGGTGSPQLVAYQLGS